MRLYDVDELDEADAITTAVGAAAPPLGAVILAAFQGRLDRTSSLRSVVQPRVIERGQGFALGVLRYGSTIQHLGLGQYDQALRSALDVFAHGRASVLAPRAGRCGRGRGPESPPGRS